MRYNVVLLIILQGITATLAQITTTGASLSKKPITEAAPTDSKSTTEAAKKYSTVEAASDYLTTEATTTGLNPTTETAKKYPTVEATSNHSIPEAATTESITEVGPIEEADLTDTTTEAPPIDSSTVDAESTTNQTTVSPCEDNSKVDCAKLKPHCSDRHYNELMKEYCRKTCSRCDELDNTTTICNDASDMCEHWRANEFCSSTFYTSSIKRKYCKKTCRLCS